MKNKIIDVISDIVSKRQRNFTENFTVYILNTGKIGKGTGIQIWQIFRRPFFWDDINVTIIL